MAINSTSSTACDFLILAPSYNENEFILPFLRQLDVCLSQIGASFTVVIINDASTKEILTNFKFSTPSINFKVLHLPFHRTQQEAIAKGLAAVRHIKCKSFIVMQPNGEDHPEAIAELIKVRNKDIVLVDKGPRTENKLFWVIYRLYQSFFRLLTGKEINWGIYSLINRKTLNLLVEGSFIHYTTHLNRLPLRLTTIRFEKKVKQTAFKTAYQHLFKDSVRSFMEFGDDLLTIFIKSAITFGFFFFAATLLSIYLYVAQEIVLPTWSYVLLIGLFNGLFLSIGFFAVGTMSLRGHYDQAKAYSSESQTKENVPRARGQVTTIRNPMSLN